MKNKVCAICGFVINDDENIAYTVNAGTCQEYIECVRCHDQEWEVNTITDCAGCGCWFSTSLLQSEEVVPGHTFCSCPACGKDIVEGLTKEDFINNIQNIRLHLKKNPNTMQSGH